VGALNLTLLDVRGNIHIINTRERGGDLPLVRGDPPPNHEDAPSPASPGSGAGRLQSASRFVAL
jgi:hypothetical protein